MIKLDDYIHYIVHIVCLIAIVIFMSTTCTNYNKWQTAKNNISAIQDTMRVVRTENGNLLAYKEAYQITSKEYADYMDVTKKQIRDLEKKLDSKVDEIIVTKTEVRLDTVECVVEVARGDTTTVRFGYSDEWTTIGGNTVVSQNDCRASIDSLKINVPLTVGFTKDNKCFATSDCPYINFTSVDGASSLSKKRNNMAVGLQLTVGPAITYDPFRNQFSGGISFVVGFGWTPLGYTFRSGSK